MAIEALNDHGILTASGTNEFEMLSFTLDGNVYGVNVSKVKEIIKYQNITPIPGADERILGMTMPRDEIITVVDLRKCLFGKQSEKNVADLFIICHFNNITTAFQVDSVRSIKRYSWKQIIPANAVISGEEAVVTGMIHEGEDIINVLDFEKIMVDIDVNNGLTVKDIDTISEEQRERAKESNIKVLVADDSRMLNKLITESIKKAGYEVTSAYDGVDALKLLTESVSEGRTPFDVVISDIEMPEMDGLAFCRTVKANENTKHIPFVLFSSLIDEPMRNKCKSVGADYCMTKPEIGKVIDIINSLLN